MLNKVNIVFFKEFCKMVQKKAGSNQKLRLLSPSFFDVFHSDADYKPLQKSNLFLKCEFEVEEESQDLSIEDETNSIYICNTCSKPFYSSCFAQHKG